MSLINEALKKAQRDRGSDSLPPMPGVGRGPGRRQKMSTSTLVMIASGVLALFVLCVVATVFLVNRQPAPKPVITKSPVTVVPSPIALAPDTDAGSPMIVLPVFAKPSPTPATAATPTPVSSPSEPVALTTPAPPSASASSPISINLFPPRNGQPAADKFDARLQTMVDSWRVTAVRSTGDDSKLFMNGSVYRVDDVIDRASGLRLTKVAVNVLTFTDADGVIYVKRY